jgi:hypothetical protein
MLNKLMRNARRAGATAAIAATALLGGQAHALQYIGKWDPAFGVDFATLGWKGQAVFFIPDACLASDGVKTNAGVCSGMSILSAEVDFYDLGSPGTIIDKIFFTTPSTDVTSMTVLGGSLSAVVGQFDYFVESNINGPGGGGKTSFELGFIQPDLENLARLAFKYLAPCPEDDEECKTKRKREKEEFDDELCLVTGFSQTDGTGGAGKPLISFARLSVPEPGSVALMLPALGLLAAFRRRKAAA